MTPVLNNLFDRTIANGGGTFEAHAPNGERADITAGFAVAIVDGTWREVHVNDRKAFNMAIARIMFEFPYASAIGTWVDGDTIHIDPVMVADNESTARVFAINNHQLAYFNLNTMTEVRL
jgi:hypothetical protein